MIVEQYILIVSIVFTVSNKLQYPKYPTINSNTKTMAAEFEGW